MNKIQQLTLELEERKILQANPSSIGAAGELAVSHHLMLQGFEVFRNLSGGGSCDLVVMCHFSDKERPALLRLEVKSEATQRHADRDKFDILAIVSRDGQIKYKPPIISWSRLMYAKR